MLHNDMLVTLDILIDRCSFTSREQILQFKFCFSVIILYLFVHEFIRLDACVVHGLVHVFQLTESESCGQLLS